VEEAETKVGVVGVEEEVVLVVKLG